MNERFQSPQTSEFSVFQRRTAEETRRATEELAARLQIDTRRGNGTDFSQRFHQESKSLLSWAVTCGWLISIDRLSSSISNFSELEGGNEHQVYRDSLTKRVIKLTRPPAFGAQGEAYIYLNNFLAANLLFGDDIRLEGLVEASDGLRFVISQPFVEGQISSKERIESYFFELGFVLSGTHSFRHQESGLIIADARPANVLEDTQGMLFPIDVQVLWPAHDLSELWGTD